MAVMPSDYCQPKIIDKLFQYGFDHLNWLSNYKKYVKLKKNIKINFNVRLGKKRL